MDREKQKREVEFSEALAGQFGINRAAVVAALQFQTNRRADRSDMADDGFDGWRTVSMAGDLKFMRADIANSRGILRPAEAGRGRNRKPDDQPNDLA